MDKSVESKYVGTNAKPLKGRSQSAKTTPQRSGLRLKALTLSSFQPLNKAGLGRISRVANTTQEPFIGETCYCSKDCRCTCRYDRRMNWDFFVKHIIPRQVLRNHITSLSYVKCYGPNFPESRETHSHVYA